MSARKVLAGAMLALLFAPRVARANAEDLYGFGSRSAGLAQADVADADPAAAAYAGPTAAIAKGFRLQLAYAHAWTRLTFRGNRAPIEDVAGTDIGLQFGKPLSADFDLGGAVALHLPDRGLARVGFRAAGEPQFLRYDAAAHRTTVDAVLAARWRAVTVAAGAELGVSAGGNGVEFDMPQDARGPHADSAADVVLGEKVAPIVAVSVDLGLVSLAARLRGATSMGVDIRSVAVVAVTQNPLDGTTTVIVNGDSGYDPLAIDLGARFGPFESVRAFVDLRYERWRDAPPPVATFAGDLQLGITPSELLGTFGSPHYRDTLSPRLGVEIDPEDAIWAARAGWAFQPSPVPRARGFLTPIDPARHVASLGGSLKFGRVWGVDLAVDGHAALHVAVHDEEQKESAALPWAHYDVGGHVVQAGLALRGGFR